MKKRLVNILAAAAALAVIIIAVLLCGCAQKDDYEKCAEAFFNALQAKDYDAIYDMMTPSSQSSISREKLKEYYDKVYSALEVTGIETSEFERVNQDRDAVFNYSLKLTSQSCGELSFDSSVTVRALLGFYLVEWTPGNVGVWKAIKELTSSRISLSALELARKAGWNENILDVETRVTTAIAALEEAGYIRRGQNNPCVFADSILAKTAQEAIDRITVSPRFDDTQKE